MSAIKDKKERLVFAGGGTAGHIMPCVALIEQLRERYEIHYIGSAGGMEKQIIADVEGVVYHEIECVKLSRSLKPSNALIPFRLIKGVMQAKRLLKSLKPRAVFSKGGYVALPVALAARCPLISHESDPTIGLANRLVKNKSLHFCCAYKETAQSLSNGVFTGLPLRKSLFKPKNLNPSRPTLLIMGGSLGAKALNECITACIDEILHDFDVIHITGKGKANPHLAGKNGYTQMEFCADMGSIYAKADLALSRGGATALFELAALKIPSVIVPLKKSSRGDQAQNAAYFAQKGLCMVVNEEDLSPKTLVESLKACHHSTDLKQRLADASTHDATEIITHLIDAIKP